MSKIYILTGETASGKTTNLKFWCKNKTSVDGILSPIVNEKRCLYHIKTGDIQKLETNRDHPGALRVGRYFFNPDGFTWAQIRLEEAVKSLPKWLIVDECGPLELTGKGYTPFLDKLILPNSTNLLIVIRKNLLNQFIEQFQSLFVSFKLITLSDLKYLG